MKANKLKELSVKNAKPKKKIYKICDGERLYLVVYPTGTRVWRIIWKTEQKDRQYTIGEYPTISLSEARERKLWANSLISKGIDPNEEIKREKKEQLIKETREKQTFSFVAKEWYDNRTLHLSKQYRHTIKTRIDNVLNPKIGNIPIRKLRVSNLKDALKHLNDRTDLQRRIAQYANNICEYAVNCEYIEINVATNLVKVLPRRKPVTHRSSIINPKEFGKLLQVIEDFEGSFIMKYALKIMPYVFVRSKELRMAKWEEIDFEKKIWVIPKEHMKNKKEHIVPLVPQVIDLFKELLEYKNGEFIFYSFYSKARCITDATLLKGLRRMGYDKNEMSIHGFRTTASTLLNEAGFRKDIIEAQLSHSDKDEVRATYNMADYLKERRQMLECWANYLDLLRKDPNTEERLLAPK